MADIGHIPFFGAYLFRKSALFPNKIDMRTRSVYGFFLTWVGSYENHCFGINAHTFIFQLGHHTKAERHWPSEPTHFTVDSLLLMQQTAICCGGWWFIWSYFCAVRCSTRFSSGAFTVSYLHQPCFIPDTHWWIQADNVRRRHLPLQANQSSCGLQWPTNWCWYHTGLH